MNWHWDGFLIFTIIALGNVNQRADWSTDRPGFPSKMANLCGLRQTIEKQARWRKLIQ